MNFFDELEILCGKRKALKTVSVREMNGVQGEAAVKNLRNTEALILDKCEELLRINRRL